MVRRAVIAGLAAVAAVVALVMPAPDERSVEAQSSAPPPLATTTGIWYCSGGDLTADPIFNSVLVDRGNASVTLLAGGEVVDLATVQSEAGLAQFNAGDVLPFYNGAAIVEVSEAPSAGGLLLVGDGVLAGSSCDTPAKEVYLVGGSTGPDLSLMVRLYNPLLESGVADLTVTTEFGLEPLLDFDRVVVGPRSWVDVPLDRLLGERRSVSLRLTVPEGVVIGSFVSRLTTGAAIWNGESLAERWEFPVTVRGSGTSVSVWNPNEEPAQARVRVYDGDGLVETREATIGPLREAGVAITTNGGAVVVDADSAVAASLTYEGALGHAATAGISQPATRWLVPVIGSQPAGTAWLGIFNPGPGEATVLVRPVGSGQATQLILPPEVAVNLEASGAGLEVSSDSAVTVGWRLDVGTESALGRAVPIR